MLYDEIKKDGTTSGWSNDDYKCFSDLKVQSVALQSSTSTRPSTSPLSAASRRNTLPRPPPNIFFIILYEMGLDYRDVRRIMGITPEVIRYNHMKSEFIQEIIERTMSV